MTSTGSVDRMTPSRHLLIIVARVIAATKCKLGANCCRWSVRPPPTPSRRAARVIQRILKMFQGNCVVCVVSATGGGDETPGRCERTPVCGNLRGPARRRNADLLCAPASCLERRFRRPDVRRYSSRVGGPIQTGPGSVGGLAGAASPPVLCRTPSKCLRGKQHGQDCCVGMADRVDTDAADHRGDRAVGFCLHPGRSMLQP
ncbi:MAG: hypothetical protein QOE48_6490 [Mycobacterium sp.]|nr:hypothetical protein [Mycobacterium sp.]